MRKLLSIFIPVLVFVNVSHAQGKLNISSTDTLAFVLMLNDVRITNVPCTDITLPEVMPGKLPVKMFFPRIPGLEISQDLVLKQGTNYSYNVSVVKGKHKLTLVSESSSIPVAVANAGAQGLNNVFLDSLAVDSLVFIPPVGDCESPVSEKEFEGFGERLSEIQFEKDKLSRMIELSSQSCLYVEQLRRMLKELSMEDNKLKLVEAARGHIFDSAELENVVDDFYLEKNKAKVRALIAE